MYFIFVCDTLSQGIRSVQLGRAKSLYRYEEKKVQQKILSQAHNWTKNKIT